MKLILGGGPSGLICGSYLKEQGEDFLLISSGGHGFSEKYLQSAKFKSGQKTLFAHEDMDEFLKDKVGELEKVSLSDLTGVFYKGGIYRYPVQNNLPFREKLFAWWSYILRDRKKSKSNKFAHWVVGNFGEYLGTQVILPHTWKTIKEDLWEIQAQSFGKKVIPVKLFGNKQKEVFEYSNTNEILKSLKFQVMEKTMDAIVLNINLEKKYVEVKDNKITDCDNTKKIDYDSIINTIALPNFMKLIKDANKQEIIDVATRSLHWNNMFLASMLVPTKFIKLPHKIVYFPEREYIFSKVNITRSNGYSVVSCEISFRKNDAELYGSEAYRNKILEKIEYDLKKAGILIENMFATYETYYNIISPAYIICDSDYDMYNNILQTWLHHHNIDNVGRFAEWVPHKRVEHSLLRIKELYNGN